MSDKRKIKKYIINPSFQISYTLLGFLPTALAVAILFSLIQYYFYQLRQEGLALALPQGHPYFMLLADQETLMIKIFVVFGLFLFMFNFLWGAWLSHRIAGPLYRLNKYLQEEHSSPKPPLTFRKGDFFQEIPASFNQWLKKNGMDKY